MTESAEPTEVPLSHLSGSPFYEARCPFCQHFHTASTWERRVTCVCGHDLLLKRERKERPQVAHEDDDWRGWTEY